MENDKIIPNKSRRDPTSSNLYKYLYSLREVGSLKAFLVMLSHSDLKKGILFIYQGQPYEVLDYTLSFKGRGRSVAQTKIKNLITGGVLSQNFKAADTFHEAEIEKIKLQFLYSHRDKYIFVEANDKTKRIELTKQQVGDGSEFLKPEQEVEGWSFQGKIINISLPIKVCLKVTQAPPDFRGGRAEAGTKQVTLETDAQLQVPLFINEGDIIEINTQTREYVRRVE